MLLRTAPRLHTATLPLCPARPARIRCVRPHQCVPHTLLRTAPRLHTATLPLRPARPARIRRARPHQCVPHVPRTPDAPDQPDRIRRRGLFQHCIPVARSLLRRQRGRRRVPDRSMNVPWFKHVTGDDERSRLLLLRELPAETTQ
uniref:Uncharacterized protein n=1 Tax=Aegilops tauschii subsp. strangulata TaxID=200361 RepID=A0A452ZNN6_AEGTS